MFSLRHVASALDDLPLFNVARTFATTSKTAKKTLTLKQAKQELKAIEKEVTAALKDEKEVRQEAFKELRKIGTFPYYMKQMCPLNDKSYKELAKGWNNLPEAEKEKYKAGADKYYKELLKKFPPKPSPPSSTYGAFVKERYPHGGTDKSFGEITKDIAKQWKQLTPAEKEAYKTPQSVKMEYRQALKLWKQQRLTNYKEPIAAK